MDVLKNLLVAVYDKKARTWSDVITVPNKPTAIRMLDQLVKSGTSIQSKYPEDFDCYLVADVGVDDDGHMTILPVEPKVHICSGVDFVSSPKEV